MSPASRIICRGRSFSCVLTLVAGDRRQDRRSPLSAGRRRPVTSFSAGFPGLRRMPYTCSLELNRQSSGRVSTEENELFVECKSVLTLLLPLAADARWRSFRTTCKSSARNGSRSDRCTTVVARRDTRVRRWIISVRCQRVRIVCLSNSMPSVVEVYLNQFARTASFVERTKCGIKNWFDCTG